MRMKTADLESRSRFIRGRVETGLQVGCTIDLGYPEKRTVSYALPTTLTNRTVPVSIAFSSVHIANSTRELVT